jgi:hypothetical protein
MSVEPSKSFTVPLRVLSCAKAFVEKAERTSIKLVNKLNNLILTIHFSSNYTLQRKVVVMTKQLRIYEEYVT